MSVVLIFGSTLLAQEPEGIHQHTAPPADARFEIVQSELAAKWTFRLDRFTGHVAKLIAVNPDAKEGETVTPNGSVGWEDTPVIGIGLVEKPTRAHFQIFTSGIAAIHTYLIDTDTGKTWVLVSDKAKRDDGTEFEVNKWQPFVK
jgi:hypothetical protein